jgi:hypothetical protein
MGFIARGADNSLGLPAVTRASRLGFGVVILKKNLPKLELWNDPKYNFSNLNRWGEIFTGLMSPPIVAEQEKKVINLKLESEE